MKISTTKETFSSLQTVGVFIGIFIFGIFIGQLYSQQQTWYVLPKVTPLKAFATVNPIYAIDQDLMHVSQSNSIPTTASAQIIFNGPRDKKEIALTFDAEMTDGMKNNLLSHQVQSSYDPRIIDILQKTNTKATLFLTGMWIELYKDTVIQLAQNPLFELASHSYADNSFAGDCYGLQQLSYDQAVEQVGETELLLKLYTGKQNKYFRFPGGCYSTQSIAIVKQTSDKIVHWDVAGEDGFNNNTNSIVENIVNNVQNGSIIILHLNGAPTAPKTAEALPIIIESLKKNGYSFVTVSDLLQRSETAADSYFLPQPDPLVTIFPPSLTPLKGKEE